MKQNTIIFSVTVLLLSVLLFSGCQEENLSSQEKQIRMLKNDKLQLQKQIQELNKEIENQKQLVKDCKKDGEKLIKSNEDAANVFMEIISEIQKKIQVLTAENEDLKRQLNN